MPLKRLLLAIAAVACAHAPGSPQMEERGFEGAEEPAREVSARAYHHYLDALLARQSDDLQTAAEQLREALRNDPESPHLHTVLAEVLLKQGRVEEAEYEIEAALRLDPLHAPARLLRARLAASRGQLEQARADLQAAIVAQPDDPDGYRDLVRLFLAIGDVDAAEGPAQRLADRLRTLQARPEEDSDAMVAADRLRESATQTWVELGRWCAQHDRDDAAQRAFASARAISPSDLEALAAEGAWLESKRRFAEARERYLRMLAQRPDGPEILAALARLALNDGDLDAVTAHAQKLMSMAANTAPWDGKPGAGDDDRRDLASALLRVAVPMMGAHRSGEAQTALEAALRLYPDHPELSFYRALAMAQRGKPREAAAAFEALEKRLLSGTDAQPVPAFIGMEARVLALDARVHAAVARARGGEGQEAMRRMRAVFAQKPADEGVALALLEVFDRAGKIAEAERLLSQAALAHPGTDGILYALASAQDRAGATQKALSTMRDVLALQPQHAGALNYIGYTLVERGEPGELREAEMLLSRAVDLRPDDGALADSYGYCLLKLGRAQEAVPELRRADRLAPEDPVILAHLGEALLAAGKKDEAAATFRHALSTLSSRDRRTTAARRNAIDPPDRLDREEAKVRTQIEEKLRSLAP
jgi:Flp pilus assembly protein TadD